MVCHQRAFRFPKLHDSIKVYGVSAGLECGYYEKWSTELLPFGAWSHGYPPTNIKLLQ